jgi:plasmid stabilization system protein ParE
MTGTQFNPLAERELAEAIQYYDEQSPGLGQRFLEEVEHALTFIRRHPEAAPRVLGSVRRLVLPRFPYNLLYRPLKSGDLRILAVAHQKRHPGYWVGRR